ncbi:MAG: DUF6464 family protein [Microcoleaceae cyanobacterium]
MEPDSQPTEIILIHPRQTLGSVHLDWTPQPGNYLEFKGQIYTLLERRHQYQLKSGRYILDKIAIYVQSAPQPTDRSLVNGRWIVGDRTCRYNAHSELIRCAVNPEGPCDRCQYYDS